MTPPIHEFHAATLPVLLGLRDRLPAGDRAGARISTDCFPSKDDLCAIQMTVRPDALDETLVLSVVLSVWDGHLELDVEIQDLNNHFHSAYAVLAPVRGRVVGDVAEAVEVVQAALPGWVDALVPLLEREQAYQALPFPPDGRFRSSSVMWFDKPNPRLGGRTPAEAIVAGELSRAVEAARAEEQ